MVHVCVNDLFRRRYDWLGTNLAQPGGMKHPNLVWEVRRADGSVMSCLLESGASTHTVVKYVDGEFSDVEEFRNLRAARQRTRLLYVEAARGPRAESGRDSDTQRRNSESMSPVLRATA